jgi:hypothetical protein
LVAGPVSRRLKITLSDSIAEKVEDLAAKTDEPMSRVAAQAIRERLAVDTGTESAQAHRVSSARPHRQGDNRPPWLEPYGGDREWRAWIWGGIVALHGRYPKALAALNDGWWTSDAHVETLSALVIWRQWIDDAAQDPREELAFQAQLVDYSHALRQEGGGVTRAWKPGVPPDEWC